MRSATSPASSERDHSFGIFDVTATRPEGFTRDSGRVGRLSVPGGRVDLLNRRCNDWDEMSISFANAPECIMRNGSRYHVGDFEGGVSEFGWNDAALDLDKFQGDELPNVIAPRVTPDDANCTTYSSREAEENGTDLVVTYFDTLEDTEAAD